MKIKNLQARKTIFLLGLSITLMGCNNYEVKTTDTQMIEEVNDDYQLEVNNVELEEVKEEKNELDIESIEYKENSYTTNDLNLRDNSSLEGNVITVIDKCQKLMEVLF